MMRASLYRGVFSNHKEHDFYDISGHTVYQRLEFVLRSAWTKTSLGEIAKARENCARVWLGTEILHRNRVWYVKRTETRADQFSLIETSEDMREVTPSFKNLVYKLKFVEEVEVMSFLAEDEDGRVLHFIPGWDSASPFLRKHIGIGEEIPVELLVPPMSLYRSANASTRQHASSVVEGISFVYEELVAKTNLGEVYLARQASNGLIVAVKKSSSNQTNYLENPLQEIAILHLAQQVGVHHPNIMAMLKYYCDDEYVYYAMPMAGQPSMLDQFADKALPPMTEAQGRDFLRQICIGLKHMHDLEIVVRDISLSNAFWFTTEDGSVRYALGDFGRSFRFPRDRLLLRNGSYPYGKSHYSPPEQFRKDCVIYPYKGDIWAVGVMLYQVLTKRSLCSAANPTVSQRFQVIEAHGVALIVENDMLEVHEMVSQDLLDLLAGMLTVSPHDRFDVDQVLNHRWLN